MIMYTVFSHHGAAKAVASQIWSNKDSTKTLYFSKNAEKTRQRRKVLLMFMWLQSHVISGVWLQDILTKYIPWPGSLIFFRKQTSNLEHVLWTETKFEQKRNHTSPKEHQAHTGGSITHGRFLSRSSEINLTDLQSLNECPKPSLFCKKADDEEAFYFFNQKKNKVLEWLN